MPTILHQIPYDIYLVSEDFTKKSRLQHEAVGGIFVYMKQLHETSAFERPRLPAQKQDLYKKIIRRLQSGHRQYIRSAIMISGKTGDMA